MELDIEFQACDADGDGALTLSELRALLTQLGYDLSHEADWRVAATVFRPNARGLVTRKEFLAQMATVNLPVRRRDRGGSYLMLPMLEEEAAAIEMPFGADWRAGARRPHWGAQLGVLLLRAAAHKARCVDRAALDLLVAVATATLIGAAFGSGWALEAAPLWSLASVVALGLLCALHAVPEVAAERSVIVFDALAGVPQGAYWCARLAALLFDATLRAAAFAGVLFVLLLPRAGFAPLFTVLWCVALATAPFGALCALALSPSLAYVVAAALPLALGAALGGALVPVAQLPAVLAHLSLLCFSRWGVEALADAELRQGAAAGFSQTQRAVLPAEAALDTLGLAHASFARSVAVLCVLGAVAAAACYALLRYHEARARKDPDILSVGSQAGSGPAAVRSGVALHCCAWALCCCYARCLIEEDAGVPEGAPFVHPPSSRREWRSMRRRRRRSRLNAASALPTPASPSSSSRSHSPTHSDADEPPPGSDLAAPAPEPARPRLTARERDAIVRHLSYL
jgi:hypothetical protein